MTSSAHPKSMSQSAMMAILLFLIVFIYNFAFFHQFLCNTNVPSSHGTMPLFKIYKCIPFNLEYLVENIIISEHNNYYILKKLLFISVIFSIIESIKYPCSFSTNRFNTISFPISTYGINIICSSRCELKFWESWGCIILMDCQMFS